MKNIFIFFGPPGSGKGTQADMLAEKMKLPVVSPGELLRHEINAKTDLGLEVEKKLAKGKMVANEIVEKIIDRRLSKRDAQKGFVLDGYPRTKNQLNNLSDRLKKISSVKDNVYAFLVDVKDLEVKKRLGGRRVCDCGASYHLKYNPPKKKGFCDLCGNKLSIREDDKPAVIRDRLYSYHKKIKPLLGYWSKDDRLIIIDGSQPIKKVEKDIQKFLKQKKIV